MDLIKETLNNATKLYDKVIEISLKTSDKHGTYFHTLAWKNFKMLGAIDEINSLDEIILEESEKEYHKLNLLGKQRQKNAQKKIENLTTFNKYLTNALSINIEGTIEYISGKIERNERGEERFAEDTDKEILKKFRDIYLPFF